MKRYKYFLLAGFLVVAAGAFFFLTRTRPGEGTPPKYVFLITLDTTRADYVDYSTSGNTLTPNLARLAGEGITFPQAYSLIPITLPSHASMFYSLPPHRLKIYNNQQVNNTSYPSLAQLFKENGYQTGAVISLGVLGSTFNMSGGFDSYRENFRPSIWYRTAGEVNRDAIEMIKEAGDRKSFFWIHYSDPHAPYAPPDYQGEFSIFYNGDKIYTCNSIDQPQIEIEITAKPGRNELRMNTSVPYSTVRKSKPVIMGINFLNFTLTAETGEPDLTVQHPREWKGITPRGKFHYFSRKRNTKTLIVNRSKKPIKIKIRFNYKIMLNRKSVMMLYRQEVQYMDQKIGELIDFLKKSHRFEDSFFLVMGDHGEGLGEHRKCVGHIHYLNKLYLNVPLLLAGRGLKKTGRSNPDLATNLNVAPTLLDIAGIKKPDHMVGDSLFKHRNPDQLLLETYAPEAYSDGFSIIRYPDQIIYYPQGEDEKFEFINLKNDKLGIHNLFRLKENQKIKSELINSVVKIAKELQKMKKNPGVMTPEQIEILKSLGYL